jgi:hypothetical protein
MTGRHMMEVCAVECSRPWNKSLLQGSERSRSLDYTRSYRVYCFPGKGKKKSKKACFHVNVFYPVTRSGGYVVNKYGWSVKSDWFSSCVWIFAEPSNSLRHLWSTHPPVL